MSLFFFSLNSGVYATYTHIAHTLTYTHSYSTLPSHPPSPHIPLSTASVHECPVPGRGAAPQGVRVAAGGAAWRGGHAHPDTGGGRVPGGVGSPAGKAGRPGSHPAEKTSPGDLTGRNEGKC